MDNTMLGVTDSPLLQQGSRGKMLAYLNDPKGQDVSVDIRQKLESRQLRLADHIVYSVKPVSGKTVKMFEPQDSMEVGIRNIDRGRMEKERILLVSDIRITAAVTFKEGTIRADDESLVQKAKFYPIDHKFPVPGVFTNVAGKVAFVADGGVLVPGTITGSGYSNAAVLNDEDGVFDALENGEFTFSSNRKDIYANYPLSVFKSNIKPEKPGIHSVDNPRVIGDGTEVTFNIDLGTEVDADGDAVCVWLKVELIGTGTLPA
jgi:hypothetical protein